MEFSNLYSAETLFLSILLILITFYFTYKIKSRKLPPGPWNLPFVGYLLWMGKYPHLTLTNLSKKYGDIYQIKFGNNRVVVLNGHNTIREALTGSTALYLADRPYFYLSKFFRGHGITFEKYSDDYKIRRKTVIRALTTFGNKENQDFHELLENICSNLVECLSNPNDQPICPKEYTNHAVGKVISSLCYGKEFLNYENAYHQVMNNVEQLSQFASQSNLINLYPWMAIFFRTKVKVLKNLVENFENIMFQLIEEHKHSSGDPKNVSEAIIKATEEMKQDGEKMVQFTNNDLASMARELLGAGFATVSTTLQWAIIFMTLHQDIQKKVQQEIDSVMGNAKSFTITDRSKLPFTEATLIEVQRMASIVPLGVPRCANKNFTLKSYFIPKNTTILANLWSAHKDPTVWNEPEIFNPLRYLNPEGNEIVNTMAEKIIPFGAGRRRCVGEIVARIELFVFFSTLMHQCKFECVPGKEIDIKKCTFGLVIIPDDFYVSIKRRK